MQHNEFHQTEGGACQNAQKVEEEEEDASKSASENVLKEKKEADKRAGRK